MRSQQDILNRIEERKEEDLLGFEVKEYLDFLTFENAKPFLKPETTKEQWDEVYHEPTAENILKVMLSYMPFAWEKANNCRGISANRSISHYDAWLWLMDDGGFEVFDKIEYEHYGKEKLIVLCEKYGWDWKQWDQN